MVLEIDLVFGADLVNGNAIHHMEVISFICWGYCCIEGGAGINYNCCAGSVETWNGCWLFNSCFSGAVVKNPPKIFPRNILYGNVITSN